MNIKRPATPLPGTYVDISVLATLYAYTMSRITSAVEQPLPACLQQTLRSITYRRWVVSLAGRGIQHCPRGSLELASAARGLARNRGERVMEPGFDDACRLAPAANERHCSTRPARAINNVILYCNVYVEFKVTLHEQVRYIHQRLLTVLTLHSVTQLDTMVKSKT